MTLLKLLLLPTLATAHFTLNTPAAIGPFSEDTESTAPCGGVSLAGSAMTNATNFHVGGEPIALFLGHPQGNWLFRGTLDTTAQANWTQIYPTFTQTGTGDYCQPAVAAPASWAGKMGILGVAMDGPDGVLYQVSLPSHVLHCCVLSYSLLGKDALLIPTYTVRHGQLRRRIGHLLRQHMQEWQQRHGGFRLRYYLDTTHHHGRVCNKRHDDPVKQQHTFHGCRSCDAHEWSDWWLGCPLHGVSRCSRADVDLRFLGSRIT